jgi:AcrR family transcriptional regulator
MSSMESAAQAPPDRPRAPRGRPRDRAIDEAALAAARELLAEFGWERTTMVAIADRAGVGKPALYRRWRSKTHLVFEAVFGWMGEYAPIADATDPNDWISRSYDYTLELFGRPEVREAVPGLIASLRDHPDLQGALWLEFGRPGVAMLAEILRKDGASEADSFREASAIMTLIIGSSLLVQMLGGGSDARSITELLPRLIQPRPGRA